MRISRLAAACLSLSGLLFMQGAIGADDKQSFSYENQESWKGVLDQAQSPIDIVTSQAVAAQSNEPRAIVMRHLDHATGMAEDTGHAVQFNSHSTEATIRGRYFRMAQFHMHAASEHTLDGKQFPLEGHFVFKAQDGRLAVIGVMYQEGRANRAMQRILDDLAGGADVGKMPRSATVDIKPLLPASMGYYHYLGSLTTPPLTQNVEWYVLKQPVALSSEQLAALRKHYPRNNRAIQPLNGRPVIEFGG